MEQQTLIIGLIIPEKSNSPSVSPAIGLEEAVKKTVRPSSGSNPFDLGEALTRKPNMDAEREVSKENE